MLTFTKFIALVVTILADLCDHVNGMDLYEGSSCKMKDGRVGVCTKLPECESIIQALEMRNFPFENLVRCSFIGLTEVICCPDKTPENPVSSPPRGDLTGIIFPDDLSSSAQIREPNTTSNTTSSRYGNDRKASIACKMYSQNVSKLLDFHIFDGEPTVRGEFPHMAALGYPSLEAGVNWMWLCGGSLISDRYVLTAAHCVVRPDQPTLIRLGTNYLNRTSDDTLDVGVQLITPNPQYNTSRKYHDIALIRLNVSVQFSDLIRPACLYTDVLDVQPNLQVVVIGWGTISLNNNTKSSLLLKVNLTIVGLESCNQSYVNYGLQRGFPDGLNNGQLCAFDPAQVKDTCEGDSGGPLQITTESGVSTVVGVVSFGIICTSIIPGVYARVAFYLDWIEGIVWT